MRIANYENNITVSVCVITYNQESYIGKVIDFILSQETNYAFEIVIGEDCSTDKTLEICKKYAMQFPDKINLLAHSNNLGLIGNFMETIRNCKGKYIALCAGDDYWIDPKKLEMQTSFLEKNESFSMVATEIYSNSHNVKRNFKQFSTIIINNLFLSGLYKTSKIFMLYFNNEDEFWKRRRLKFTDKRPKEDNLNNFLNDIQCSRFYPASTIFIRREIIEKLPDKALNIWGAEHLPFILWSALHGQIKLFRNVTVMKNTTPSSVSVTKAHLNNNKRIKSKIKLIELLKLAGKHTTDHDINLINQKIDTLKS